MRLRHDSVRPWYSSRPELLVHWAAHGWALQEAVREPDASRAKVRSLGRELCQDLHPPAPHTSAVIIGQRVEQRHAVNQYSNRSWYIGSQQNTPVAHSSHRQPRERKPLRRARPRALHNSALGRQSPVQRAGWRLALSCWAEAGLIASRPPAQQGETVAPYHELSLPLLTAPLQIKAV